VGIPGLLQECVALAPRRSRIVVVGVCMEPDTIQPFVAVTKELTLLFVVAYERRDFELAVAMLDQRRIASDEMITDVVGLDDFSQAFEALKRPTHQCKVLLEP
jgi:(R,R)-butanediol dehydrogenase/meso-butanediol dehydrogenase/diacetyl reductase